MAHDISNIDSDDESIKLFDDAEQNEFIICSKNRYWILILNDDNWDYLKTTLTKRIPRVSSYKFHPINKGDFVLIYNKCSDHHKSGFVSLCQIKENMKKTTLSDDEKIIIFRDVNMNRYYSDVRTFVILKNSFKISQLGSSIKKDDQDFNINTIRSNIMKIGNTFSELKKDIGKYIVKLLIVYHQTSVNNIKSDSGNESDLVTSEESNDSSSDISIIKSDQIDHKNKVTKYISDDDSSNSDDENSSYSDDSTDSSKSVESDKHITGNIPILMIPCNVFEWNNSDDRITIKNFKEHFINCTKCDKIDNNNNSIMTVINDSKYKCQTVEDESKIDIIFKYYDNLVGYNVKYKKNIQLYQILSHTHIYHKCIFIVWK